MRAERAFPRLPLAIVAVSAAALLAGCNANTREVQSTPPSVSYQVTGNNLNEANARATRYCSQYSLYPQLQGVQQSGNGGLATYTCSTSAASTSNGAYAAPYAGSGSSAYPSGSYYGSGGTYSDPTLAAPVQCADLMHQDRPGGSDYHGPPVAGCPAR